MDKQLVLDAIKSRLEYIKRVPSDTDANELAELAELVSMINLGTIKFGADGGQPVTSHTFQVSTVDAKTLKKWLDDNGIRGGN